MAHAALPPDEMIEREADGRTDGRTGRFRSSDLVPAAGSAGNRRRERAIERREAPPVAVGERPRSDHRRRNRSPTDRAVNVGGSSRSVKRKRPGSVRRIHIEPGRILIGLRFVILDRVASGAIREWREIVAILNFKQRMTEVAEVGQGSKKSRKSRTPVPLFRRESNPNASGKMQEKLRKLSVVLPTIK